MKSEMRLVWLEPRERKEKEEAREGSKARSFGFGAKAGMQILF